MRAATRGGTPVPISPADPVVVGRAGVLLALVAFTAGAIPAWRAARTDPTLALREE